MAIHQLVLRRPSTPLLHRFTEHVAKAKTPETVLDALDEFASSLMPIRVLGAGRMPTLTSDWPTIQVGKDVFIHSSAPAGGVGPVRRKGR
jgi:hypothetical protein